MTCDHIHWLHSCGRINKEPSQDLGNFPSEFKIAEVTMNNLYDDVKPQEAEDGLADHRCFYIFNKHIKETVEETVVKMEPEQCEGGSFVEIASKLVNEVQQIAIEGIPDDNTYAIFDTEFGPPFTVHYSAETGFCGFKADFEAKIKMQPWCGDVIVSGCNPFTVEFAGKAQHRKVKLIRVVQNNLLSKDWSRYNTVPYLGSDPWNGVGDFLIRVTRPINEEYVPSSGILHAYNPNTPQGLFVPLEYESYSNSPPLTPTLGRGDFRFKMKEPLPFDLMGKYDLEGPFGTGSPVFDDNDPDPFIDSFDPLPAPYGIIEVPIMDHTALIHICRLEHGSPINCIAAPIEIDTDTPDVEPDFSTDPLDIGTLRPQEGFFVWTRRTTSPGTGPFLKDNFHLTFEGLAVNYPP